MAANDNGSIEVYRASLTTQERREFAQAESVIRRGLKSFLEVGLALVEIRDRRLYRQEFGTFQEYCHRRWELSRTRAYELCAASEVVADLSAIADIRLLPENEAQARPLTLLKLSKHRRRAWSMAVKKATSEGRPVTARDAEEAVKELNIPSGNGAEQESAQEILGEVAEKFSELETTMKSALNRCPGKKAVILSMVRKVKSDLKRWAEAEGRDEPGAEGFWLTPPETYAALNAQYGPFDFDPCPHPRPKGFNSLNIPWGRRNYVNPPFHPHDGVDGQGPTAFVRKAIAEQRLGKTSVLTLPVQSYVNLLLEAGAELRSLGRVRWRESTTGEPMRGPSPICCFVLRGGRTPPPGPTGPRR